MTGFHSSNLEYRENLIGFSAQVAVDEEEEARWENWDMQKGYSKEPDPATIHDTRELPLRAMAPGLHMGLSVVLDVKEDDYYCSGTESVGFKVIISYIFFTR